MYNSFSGPPQNQSKLALAIENLDRRRLKGEGVVRKGILYHANVRLNYEDIPVLVFKNSRQYSEKKK